MNRTEGAKRLGQIASLLLTLSLVTLLWFPLSATLFVSGWIVFGLAWVIDEFADDHRSQQRL